MPLFDPRTVVRASLSAVAAALVGLSLAACSASSDTSPAETVAEQDPAPVLGEYDDRIQLVEGTPYTLTAEDGDSFVLEITEYDEAEPQVTVKVTPEGGTGEETTVTLGDLIEVDGVPWRVSELGFGDSLPVSVTLTKAE
ncbi:hypothetical protein JCM3263A_01070 [Thermobifida fusca]|jgi:ABC-type glycerol-3-phosphate transport system substrate-binding protein|uniref:DUF5666 domain-containing protein n=2 Tax=Thermobifida fusca TaxID=2021 RepID=A0A9P2T9N9_THEFU|nr:MULTISPECIES: DUF6406 domain-containing protein [Thermobifida]AAZ56190.1 hypothetical protein Tfu_2157 [Thermobifida fusca YX]EOR70793.1 hypothetical protein TM51_11074 [Thermobifida fusca TM51]MBO2530263.1 hypothetical protein [Thermobifida sp.]MDD6792072.1 hypothetical protein [Thermobifida fusca]PPS95791.1 hypothetical protein BH05_01975 [Thermobifida fusca]